MEVLLLSAVLITNSSNKSQILDRGKFHLANSFSGCTELLETQSSRQKDYKQIYFCPLKSDNRFELIYRERKDDNVEISKKIKNLRSLIQTNYQSKLIVNLEDLGERVLDWQPSLFEYDPNNSGNNTTLNPENDCKIEAVEDKLFTCNSTWKVLKKRK